MPQKYTATDPQGRAVTFDWHLDTPPTDADLEEVFAEAERSGYFKQQEQPAQPSGPTHPYAILGRKIAGIGKAAIDPENLPSTTAAAGSLAAAATGVGLIPALALIAGGAGAGSLVRRHTRGEPIATPEGAVEALKEGGKEAAIEGIGRGVVGLGGKLARGLYRYAVKPNEALQREYPHLIETGLREAIPVGGSGTAKELRNLSADQARNMIQAAEARGIAGPPISEVMQSARPVIEQARLRARASGRPSEVPALLDRLKALAKSHTKPVTSTAHGTTTRPSSILGPNGQPATVTVPTTTTTTKLVPQPISLTESQGFKSELQDLVDAAVRAEERGGVVSGLDKQLDKALGQGWRRGIEARVPGVKGQNALTQELGGLVEALEKAEARQPGIGLLELAGGTGVGGPAGIATAAAIRAARDPRAISRGAIGLDILSPPAAGPALSNLLRILMLQEMDNGGTLPQQP